MLRLIDRLDIESAVEKAREFKAKKLGIQLPNGLKQYAFEISNWLEKENFSVVVSGKATYGSCDIDMELLREVDLLLHFAHTPVIDVDRVIYVPYKVDYSVKTVLELLKTRTEIMRNPEIDKISLTATSQYAHKLPELRELLKSEGFSVYLKKGSSRIKIEGQVLGCNFSSVDRRADIVLFVGDGTFHPKGIAIYSKKEVCAISPLEKRVRKFGKVDAEKFIRERYMLIIKAMDCKKFCIVASSKPGQRRLELASELKEKLNRCNQSAVLMYVDDVKLDNFTCECIINTACPRIAYDDWKWFGKPVLTPEEVEILVGERDWENYEMDEFL